MYSTFCFIGADTDHKKLGIGAWIHSHIRTMLFQVLGLTAARPRCYLGEILTSAKFPAGQILTKF